jgi:hypothetical protein
MLNDYVWSSPGGTYRVPDEFRQRLQSEFPGYRVRWSLKKHHWMIEQKVDNPDPPFRPDPFDDSLIRAKEGYWQVMFFQPGDRMACPRCGSTLKVAVCETAESFCQQCKRNGFDGRVMAGYWPFDERLLEELRQTNPLTWGVGKIDGKLRVVASARADRNNDAIVKEGYRQLSDVVTSSTIESYNRQVGIAQVGYTGSGIKNIHSDKGIK